MVVVMLIPSCPNCTGSVEEQIEYRALKIHWFVNCHMWVGVGRCELLGDPLQDASSGVIASSKDMVESQFEVRVFLVEHLEFTDEELIEVPRHEGEWWLYIRVEVLPVEVRVDGTIFTVVAEVGSEGVAVGKGGEEVGGNAPMWMGYSPK